MITLTPAYGRDYRSKAAVKADLDANRDFVLGIGYANGTYTNAADLRAEGINQVRIRYGKLRKVAVFEVPAAGIGYATNPAGYP